MGVFTVCFTVCCMELQFISLWGVQRLNGLLLPHRLVVSPCLAGFATCSAQPRGSRELLGSAKSEQKNSDKQCPFPCSEVSFRALGWAALETPDRRISILSCSD